MFIQQFAQEAHNMAKLERKPRRNIQYKDMGMTPLIPSTALL
jgi:DNA polymerase epsilon subunit 4